MKSIAYYTDYRTFLSDFYREKKTASPLFSYRTFCRKAGLKSPSIFKEVVSGKRGLTSETIIAFSKGLGLSPRDVRFFENLVLFNQAKSEEAKRKYLTILRGLRYRKPQKQIPVHLFEYYEKWYNPIIRELAAAMQWNNDYSILAKAVVPAIKTSEARESVELLLRLGFISKKPDGMYLQTDPDITTGPEVNSIAVRQLNRRYAQLGVESLDRFPPSQRDVSSLIMGIANDKLPQLKNEIADFRKRLIRLAGDNKGIDGYYAFVLEFFPVARTAEKEEVNETEAGNEKAD
jgi:uncharacterized protein (TIGR02147 family)